MPFNLVWNVTHQAKRGDMSQEQKDAAKLTDKLSKTARRAAMIQEQKDAAKLTAKLATRGAEEHSEGGGCSA
jgi:hypothetical protein